MVKKCLIILLGIIYTDLAQAQEAQIRVFASPDTVLLGNDVTVYFELNNAQGTFEAPEIDGFDVIGGPNYSSSFSLINGEASSSSTYSYILRPQEAGVFYMGSASIQTPDETFSSTPLEIVVLPNPEGIRQEKKQNYIMPDPWSAPKKKTKKKRKRGIKI